MKWDVSTQVPRVLFFLVGVSMFETYEMFKVNPPIRLSQGDRGASARERGLSNNRGCLVALKVDLQRLIG